jgi:orotate phosphoribosyltransferase
MNHNYHTKMTINLDLELYQKEFIDFLVASEVLTFGDFTTKSGRKTPYFINTGNFERGSRISKVGKFYAAHINKIGLDKVDSIFGPAYKGIPLCVATSIALYDNYKLDIGYTFDRKEAKTHGDKGALVGKILKSSDSVLIVEDVITAGTTLKEIVPTLKHNYSVSIKGVVVAVDRCERGTGDKSATDEVKDQLNIEVYPLVTIHEIVYYLNNPNSSGFTLSSDLLSRINEYLNTYGATKK